MPWHDSRKQACRENPLSDFQLDERIVRDSDLLTKIGLCELRLMKDSRWPWLMLVPQRPGASEIFDLTPLDQTMLTFETTLVAEALKTVTGATKINVAALGNIVRQLHVHVVARREGDAGWPGPVWGHGVREPYRREDLHQFVERLYSAL